MIYKCLVLWSHSYPFMDLYICEHLFLAVLKVHKDDHLYVCDDKCLLDRGSYVMSLIDPKLLFLI